MLAGGIVPIYLTRNDKIPRPRHTKTKRTKAIQEGATMNSKAAAAIDRECARQKERK